MLWFVLFSLICPSFLSQSLRAESNESGANYLDSINADEEGGRLAYPSFVFAEPVMNEIYVIDSMLRIIIFTSDFFPLFTLSRRSGIDNPQGLVVDKTGTIYVAQAGTKEDLRPKISVFNACLKWERNIYVEGFEGADSFAPYRMAIDKQGNIFVAGIHFPGVVIISPQGKFIEMLSPVEGDRKVKIINVKLDKEGRIYLLSEEESRIYVYDENKKFLFKFGDKGGSSGKLSRPKALSIDDAGGKIYVVDYMRHTINVYDKEGKYVSEFGGMGWGEGWFQHPTDITIDTKGRLLISDTFNDRIQVFRAN